MKNTTVNTVSNNNKSASGIRLNLALVLIIFSLSVFGQEISGADFKCLGPYDLLSQNLGFVNGCWADGPDARLVYAGSLYGGLWRGEKKPDGAKQQYDWENITDSYPNPGTGISALEVVPNTNGEVIFIGTQMGGNGRIYNYSNGILKTTDGGKKWKQVGPMINIRDNKIVDYLKMNPEYPNVMFARIGNDNFYTEDGWNSWKLIHPPFMNKDQFMHIADAEWKPGDPKTIYLSSRSENNEKAEFFCSKDGGNTWTDMRHGIKASNIQIDVVHKKGMQDWIYIAYAERGAFVQVYNGNNWSTNKNAGGVFTGNGYWNMEFEVNEEDTSVIYLSMTQLAKSKNGGRTFQTISDYFGTNTHADIRDLHILNPSVEGKNDIVMMANDGGVSVSYSGSENTKTWYNINGTGLSIAQLWGIGTSETAPGLVMAGGQDNGIYTLNNGKWDNQTSGVGDGYDVCISETNPDFAIGQGNSPLLVQTENRGKGWKGNSTPPGPCSNFRRPMWLDKKNHRMWIGHHQLYMKDNSNGKLNAQWVQKTFFPDMKQNNGMLFNQQINCFAVNGEKSENCLLIYSGVLWGKDSLKGKIFFTQNLNNEQTEWKDLTRYAPRVNWRELTDVVSDPNEERTFYAIWQDIYSGFKSEIVKMEIPVSMDTIIFTEITFNLPDYPCNKLCIEESSAGNLYLATDTGIYFTNYDLMNSSRWVRFESKSSTIPFVAVSDMEINKANNTLYIATYGRGLWSTPLAETGNEKTINIRKNISWNSVRRIDGKLLIANGKSLTIEKDAYITGRSCLELKKNSRIILKNNSSLKNNSGNPYDLKKIRISRGAQIIAE